MFPRAGRWAAPGGEGFMRTLHAAIFLLTFTLVAAPAAAQPAEPGEEGEEGDDHIEVVVPAGEEGTTPADGETETEGEPDPDRPAPVVEGNVADTLEPDVAEPE